MTYTIPISKWPLADIATLVRPTSYADMVTFITFLIAFCAYFARGKVWDKPDSLHHLWFEVPQLKDGFKKRIANKETTNIAEKLKQTVCWCFL
jgi:NADPH-ferrihemoprotein reductase